MKNPTILCVDDEVPLTDMLVRMLERRLAPEYSDMSILTLHTGQEALNHMFSPLGAEIDLILLDIQMTGIDGFETGKMIRSRFPNLPIIFMTGFTTYEEAKLRLVTPYKIEKPAEIAKYLKYIRIAIEECEAAGKIFNKKIKQPAGAT